MTLGPGAQIGQVPEVPNSSGVNNGIYGSDANHGKNGGHANNFLNVASHPGKDGCWVIAPL